MREQIDQLLDLVELPNVDVRLLPTDGRAACARGGFELLSRPGDIEPFMVVTVDPGGARYHEDDSIAPFAGMFAYLDSVALTPSETTRRLKTIRETYR